MIGCHDTIIIRHSGKLAVVIDCHTNNTFTISIKKDANINYHVMLVNPRFAQWSDGDKAACRSNLDSLLSSQWIYTTVID